MTHIPGPSLVHQCLTSEPLRAHTEANGQGRSQQAVTGLGTGPTPLVIHSTQVRVLAAGICSDPTEAASLRLSDHRALPLKDSQGELIFQE